MIILLSYHLCVYHCAPSQLHACSSMHSMHMLWECCMLLRIHLPPAKVVRLQLLRASGASIDRARGGCVYAVRFGSCASTTPGNSHPAGSGRGPPSKTREHLGGDRHAHRGCRPRTGMRRPPVRVHHVNVTGTCIMFSSLFGVKKPFPSVLAPKILMPRLGTRDVSHERCMLVLNEISPTTQF